MAGSLRQRSPGVWELRVFAGRDYVTGRQVSRSETFRGSKRAAERELARLVTEVGKPVGGRELPPNRVTLTQLIELHLAAHKGAPGTVGSYRSLLGRHITPTIGRLRIGAVDVRTLDRFYDHLERQGLAASTIRSAHALIRGALRQAVRWGWLATNVARDARPPTVRRDDVRLPTPAQVLCAIEAAEAYDPEFGMFVRLAAATGARRGELCALRWSDVDLDRGVVRIDAAVVTAPGRGIVIKETKTHTRRGVALDVSTASALGRHRDLVRSRAAFGGVAVAPEAFVFSSEVDGGRPWRPEMASHRWDAVRRRIGLDGVRLHDLRHFQATMLLRGGVPVKNVSKRLGHRDAATTLNVYAQFLEEADRQSADLMGRLLPAD
jgi:integrase